jgi:hypothetical protein
MFNIKKPSLVVQTMRGNEKEKLQSFGYSKKNYVNVIKRVSLLQKCFTHVNT